MIPIILIIICLLVCCALSDTKSAMTIFLGFTSAVLVILVLSLVVDFDVNNKHEMFLKHQSTEYVQVDVISTRSYKHSKKYYKEISYTLKGVLKKHSSKCSNMGYYIPGSSYTIPYTTYVYGNELGEQNIVYTPGFCAVQAPKI